MQLMPLFWMFSTFMLMLLLLMLIYFFFIKKSEVKYLYKLIYKKFKNLYMYMW